MSRKVIGAALAAALVAAVGLGSWRLCRPADAAASLVRVGGKKNACCCTQRIEPDER